MARLGSTPTFYERGEISYEEFRGRVADYAVGCFDNEAQSRSMAYTPQDGLQYVGQAGQASENLFGTAVMETGGSMTKHALSQLVERLDAPPMRWLADPRRVDGDLRFRIVNDVIQARSNRELLVRHRNNDIRAILSDKYSMFNHSDFINIVDGAIKDAGDIWGNEVNVWNAQVGDVLRAYLVVPGITFGKDPRANGNGNGGGPRIGSNGGGGLHPSIYIHNSEVGTGKIRIFGGLLTPICANGMIIWNENKGGLELVHRGLSSRTIASAVTDTLFDALEVSEKAAEQFIRSQEIFLQPDRIEELANRWADKYGITVKSTEAWTQMVTREARANDRSVPALFDFINAATYVAGDAKSNDEREQMERMAGDLLYAPVEFRYMEETV